MHIANMARNCYIPEFLSPSKAFFKVIVIGAVVILILSKLLSDSDSNQTKIPSHGSSVDEKIQNFHINKIQNQAPAAEIGNLSNVKLSESSKSKSSQLHSVWNLTDTQTNNEIHVLIPLVNVKSSLNLLAKFQTCVTSMSELSSAQIVLYVIGDEESRGVAERVVKTLTEKNVKVSCF